MKKKSSVIASTFRYVVIVLWLFLHLFNPQHHLSFFATILQFSLIFSCPRSISDARKDRHKDKDGLNNHRNFNYLLIISKQLRDDWSLLKWSVCECSPEKDSEFSLSLQHSTPQNDIDPNYFLKFWLILK